MEEGAEITRCPAHTTALAVILALTTAGITGCGDPADPAAASSQASSAPIASSPAPAGDKPVSPPAPGDPIPKDATRLAASLEKTTRALDDAIDAWVKDGKPTRGRPPEPVVLLALHQQRIYRFAARHPKVAARAYAKLPARLAKEARDNVTAIRGLLSLARPIKGSVPFNVKPPLPAGVLLNHFQAAEHRFGVEWEVLAAVMLAETKFGRVTSASYAGAQGPMQFMPATWKAYGMGGDIHDTRDAIMAAANYLRSSGAPRDYQRAVFAYNHSQAYVNAILLHARQMKRDRRNFYAYYNWQVFVLTTSGERRLTGP